MNPRSINNLELLKGTNDSKIQAERGRKGGLAKGRSKKVKIVPHKKCKNCDLPCPAKEAGTTAGWECKIPMAKRAILEAALEPQKLVGILFSRAFELDTIASGFKQKKESYYAILDLRKEITPKNEVINNNLGIIWMEGLELARKEAALRLVKKENGETGDNQARSEGFNT